MSDGRENEDTLTMARRAPSMVAALAYACFFLSGAAGLIYEIVWMRMLGLVFGHTVFAVTTVLAAFMAGLALGASLFGRLIDRRGRPLLVYGLLEAGIGAYCLLIPVLFSQAQRLYLALSRSLGLSFLAFSLSQFALVFVILLLPTTLMGASLPVMSKFFVQRLERLGQTVGDLYALNTFGAVLGSAGAGFVLLPAIGVRATTALAAALNLGIGAWAVTADLRMHARREGNRPSGAESLALKTPAGESDPLVTGLVLAGIALSGAASMVYEVTWTRALSLAIGSSVYAFSAMLTTFLVGLGLGSFLFARIWGRREVDAALFGWLEVGIGLTSLALVPAFGWMPDMVLLLMKRLTPSAGGALLTQFALSFLVMIVPTTIIGAAFPCAVQICARGLARLGRDIGQVYSWNTAGTIAGALLAGFAMVPRLGAQQSMTVAAAANAAIGVALLAVFTRAHAPWRRAVAFAPALLFAAGVLVIPRWDRQVMGGGASIYGQLYAAAKNPAALFREESRSTQLLYYREGINTTVAVERSERVTMLKVNGKVDASNGVDMETQLMLGHLPILLHPRPERVLVIGLGSGVTAGAIAQHPVVRAIDVVEMEPAVIEASAFFVTQNRGALRDPRVRVVIGDGRNFVLASPKRYDVISSEPSNPWIAGVANLFSREFYQLAREALASDGIMVQWLHSYNLFPKELKMILNTFRTVFPRSTLWRSTPGDYFLVGTAAPLVIDYRLLEERIAASPTVGDDLASLQWGRPLDLLAMFMLDETALAGLAEGAPLNTDDKPLLEFAAPLALYADTDEENSRMLREAGTSEFPTVTSLPKGSLDQRRFHFAKAFWAKGRKEEALDHLRKAPLPEPGDVAARLDRAKLLLSLGEVSQAMSDLVALAERRPQDRLIGSYLRVGGILREPRVADAMVKQLQTRERYPNPAAAHNNLGLFYNTMGIRFGEAAFFDLAVYTLQAALQIEPQSNPVLNNLANAYFELGRLDEAASTYERVLGAAPNLAETRFNLGLVYERKGMRERAAHEFREAVALKPDWPLPRKRLEQLGDTPDR